MLYDYKCKCGHVFEEYVKKYDEKVHCPKCRSTRCEKLPAVTSHQKHVMGRTLADDRIRDRLKRSNYRPKSTALFDNGKKIIG